MKFRPFFIVTAILALFLVTPACHLFDGLQGMSITTSDNLINPKDINNPDVIVVPKEDIPKELANSEKFRGKDFVLAPDELIKPDAPKIDPTPDTGDSGWLDGLASFGLSVGTVFFPKLALLEGLFVVMSRRKRQHYADAIRAALPYDGVVDLKEAASSVGKALGIAHSSDATAALNATERVKTVPQV